MADLESLGIGGGGGFIGALLGFFGFRSLVNRIDKDLQAHKKIVVYDDRFKEYKESQNKQHEAIRTEQKEQSDKLDKILLRLPNKESGG